MASGLIDFLHLGALIAVLLERRQLLDIVSLIVVLNGEAELDHAVDAAGEGALQPRSRQLAAAGTAADT